MTLFDNEECMIAKVVRAAHSFVFRISDFRFVFVAYNVASSGMFTIVVLDSEWWRVNKIYRPFVFDTIRNRMTALAGHGG